MNAIAGPERIHLASAHLANRMDYDDSPPEVIADAIAQEIGRDVDYRDVESDGAARASRRLAELL
jgi:hypothetical protein